MASLVAKKKGHQLYYYVVESARVHGKPRIVHQAYLGTADKVAALVKDRTSPLETCAFRTNTHLTIRVSATVATSSKRPCYNRRLRRPYLRMLLTNQGMRDNSPVMRHACRALERREVIPPQVQLSYVRLRMYHDLFLCQYIFPDFLTAFLARVVWPA